MGKCADMGHDRARKTSGLIAPFQDAHDFLIAHVSRNIINDTGHVRVIQIGEDGADANTVVDSGRGIYIARPADITLENTALTNVSQSERMISQAASPRSPAFKTDLCTLACSVSSDG